MIELIIQSNNSQKQIALVENGKLKMTIPNKPTSKNQKYISNAKEK